MSPSCIDVHAHHYPAAFLEACGRPDSGYSSYIRDDGRLVVLQDGAVALAAPQPMPSLRARLDQMDRAGIDTQLLSISAPSVYRIPSATRVGLTRDLNDEFMAMSDDSGGRLRALATLPLPDVPAALDELERVIEDPRVAGVFLCTTIDGATLDDARFTPLWHALSERETAVLVHPTVAPCTTGIQEFALALALDYMGQATNAIGRLVYSGTLARFPGIRWVFTHLGGSMPFVYHRFDNYYRQFPECRQEIDVPPTTFLERLHFDTVTLHPPALRCALETLGPDRLLFGTDYPHVPGGLEPFVDLIDQADLEPGALAAILAGNAEKLFAGLTPEPPDRPAA